MQAKVIEQRRESGKQTFLVDTGPLECYYLSGNYCRMLKLPLGVVSVSRVFHASPLLELPHEENAAGEVRVQLAQSHNRFSRRAYFSTWSSIGRANLLRSIDQEGGPWDCTFSILQGMALLCRDSLWNCSLKNSPNRPMPILLWQIISTIDQVQGSIRSIY